MCLNVFRKRSLLKFCVEVMLVILQKAGPADPPLLCGGCELIINETDCASVSYIINYLFISFFFFFGETHFIY